MKLLSIVTLFHPPRHVVENLLTYVPHVDGLILWDNTHGGCQVDWPEEIRQKIVEHRKGDNVGIGQALNHAINVCLSDAGFTHLLMMDQDSAFVADSFATYVAQIATTTDAQAGAFVPLLNSEPQHDADTQPRRVSGFIVSGTVLPVSTLRSIGRFEERFVIDMLDVDYAHRLRAAGQQILQCPCAALRHSLGTPLRGNFLGLHPISLNYSPLRTYYITRNLLYLTRTAQGFHRPDLLRALVWKRPFYILLMEQQKGAKLMAWLRGLWQGMRRQLTPDHYAHQL